MDSHTEAEQKRICQDTEQFAPVVQISTEAARGAAAFRLQPHQTHALLADLHRKFAKIQECERE